MSFKYETIKYKIQKGDQGFGIALGGGGSKRNEVTGEAGLVGLTFDGIILIWDYPNLGSETDRIWTGNGRGENEIGSIRIRFGKVQVRTGLL